MQGRGGQGITAPYPRYSGTAVTRCDSVTLLCWVDGLSFFLHFFFSCSLFVSVIFSLLFRFFVYPFILSLSFSLCLSPSLFSSSSQLTCCYDPQRIRQKYLADLVDRKNFEKAASMCPQILGNNVKLWESWIVTFSRIKQLKAISHRIPIDNPRLVCAFGYTHRSFAVRISNGWVHFYVGPLTNGCCTAFMVK